MASSIYQIFETVRGPSPINRINDVIYEFHRPTEGFIDLEIVFFHGFQAQGSKDAYFRTWTLADGSACWLNTWLAEEYPQSRILSVSYDSSTELSDTEGRLDMYPISENLVLSIIHLARVGQSCPVVLVGHGVGGLVLKQVCCRAEQLRYRLQADGGGINPSETFLRNMRGAFFFSTPQLGTRVLANTKRKSPLLRNYEVLNQERSRLNFEFQYLRRRFGWKTFGVIGGNTEIPGPRAMSGFWKAGSSPLVEEESGRMDMDEFCILDGEDSVSICKPKARNSSSFFMFLGFLKSFEDEEWVLKKQRLLTPQLPRVFISMPKRVEEVVQTLQLGQAEPSRVSLVGMGGIGKSTLAKELLVEIGSEFDFVCFVDDVKGMLQKKNLHSLIAENLYYGRGYKVRMQDADQESLWKLLRRKKVLLIMDNVDSEDQIRTLLMEDWPGKGSRLLTTSRERTDELMPSFHVHEVRLWSMDEAANLLRTHVTDEVAEEIPRRIFKQVVHKCDGLPLSIEVIGSYLRGKKDIAIWKDALERLGKAESINGSADDRLWAKLQVSFDGLGPPEKKLFLDLAVFEKCEPHALQYDLHIWKTVWEVGMNRSVVSIGLKNLVDKSFIRMSGEFDIRSLSNFKQPGESQLRYLALSRDANFAYIHEQLRDMGRSIARPYDERIELCRGVCQSEDVDELLDEYEGNDARTEALSVAPNHRVTPHSDKQYPWRSIGSLRQLRLLRMSNVGLTGEGAKRFPSNLGFLQMSTCSGEKDSDYWPIRAEDVKRLHKITVLVLEKCSPVCFPGNFHELSSLRLLILSGERLTKLPEKFGLLPSLQALVLEHVGLTEVPDSLLPLSSLESLKLSGCSALCKALPDWDVRTRNLQSPLYMLKRFTLEDLPAQRELPESFGLLGSLEEVFINRCSALLKLPDSLGMCHKLEDLRIAKCDSLECLGKSFGQLESLSTLFITSCRGLPCLPDSLGQLKQLRVLAIRDLDISSLPVSIWNLQEIRELRLQGLASLIGLPLPEDLGGQMDETQSTDRQRRPGLPEFGLLSNLEYLDISGCQVLQSVPECLGQIGALKKIRIADCSNLERLPGSVIRLKSLESLEIDGLERLQSLRERLGEVDLSKRTIIGGYTSLAAEAEPSQLHLQVDNMEMSLVEDQEHESRGCGDVVCAGTIDRLSRLTSEQEAQLQKQRKELERRRQELLERHRLELSLREQIEYLTSRERDLTQRLQLAQDHLTSLQQE